MTDEQFETDDFIYTKKDGIVMGGGYRINSLLLGDQQGGQYGGGSDLSKFEHLVVPAGLFYLPSGPIPVSYEDSVEQHVAAGDDLMDKLLQLASVKKAKYTKKHVHSRPGKQRRTKKRR